MSSPGMYARCPANSIESPRYGDLWSPCRKPSTTVRASRSRLSMRARTLGSRKRPPGVSVCAAARCVMPLHPGLRHGDRLEQLVDHLARAAALRLGVEVRQHAVAEHRV